MRGLLVGIAAVLVSGCSVGGGASGPTPPACALHLPPRGGAGEAILRSVAAGPAEYVAGVPGGPVRRLSFSTGFSPPRLAGNQVFFSRRSGQTSLVYRGVFGGCAYRVATGTLGEVEPRGRALTALVGSHWEMLGPDGHEIARLTGAGGGWTGDGHLIESTGGGIDVFDLSGRHHSIKLPGVAPLATLGPSQALVSSPTGVQLMDPATGALHPLGLPPDQLVRAPAGSPDGAHVAFIDSAGNSQLLDVVSGRTRPLAAPALATGFAWSADSRWLAVQSVYGGVAVQVADNRVVDTGSLVVVSW